MTRIVCDVRRALTGVAVCLIGAAGCQMPKPFALKDRTPRSDKQAPFDPPNSYPEWAHDAPYYQKPAEELKMAPKARPEDPDHFFTSKRVFPIRQPGNYTPEMLPRVAVWYTDNNGFEWKKAGYFGQAQSYYWFEAPADGDYGIRFAGPGQEPAKTPVAEPVRVYHVDTVVPDVELVVEPNQAWYNPGQQITLSYKAHDFHLIEQPCEIGVTADFSSDHPNWTVLQKDQAAEGQYTYSVPMDAVGRGLVFRVAAADRAGNLGFGFSHLVQVVNESAQPKQGASPGSPLTQSNPGGTTPAGGGEWPNGASFKPVGSAAAPSPAPTAASPAATGTETPLNAGGSTGGESSPDVQIEEITPASGTPSQSSSAAPSDIDLILESAKTGSAARVATAAPAPSAAPSRAVTATPSAAPAVAPATNAAVAPAPRPAPTVAELLEAPEPGSPNKNAAVAAAPPAARAPSAAAPAGGSAVVSAAPAIPAASPVEKSAAPVISAPPPAPVGGGGKMGLVAPLPATVSTGTPVSSGDRPWAQLGANRDASVWKLPQPSFVEITESLSRMRFYMENPQMVPAGPGARVDRPVAEVDPALDEAVRPKADAAKPN